MISGMIVPSHLKIFTYPASSYNHVTFQSGLSSSEFFYKWMIFGKERGYTHGKSFVLEQQYPTPNPNVTSGQPKRWTFDGAFPVKWKISDLSLKDSQNIVIETLELSFNFFEVEG
jgi:hypothetical protein